MVNDITSLSKYWISVLSFSHLFSRSFHLWFFSSWLLLLCWLFLRFLSRFLLWCWLFSFWLLFYRCNIISRLYLLSWFFLFSRLNFFSRLFFHWFSLFFSWLSLFSLLSLFFWFDFLLSWLHLFFSWFWFFSSRLSFSRCLLLFFSSFFFIGSLLWLLWRNFISLLWSFFSWLLFCWLYWFFLFLRFQISWGSTLGLFFAILIDMTFLYTISGIIGTCILLARLMCSRVGHSWILCRIINSDWLHLVVTLILDSPLFWRLFRFQDLAVASWYGLIRCGRLCINNTYHRFRLYFGSVGSGRTLSSSSAFVVHFCYLDNVLLWLRLRAAHSW